MLISFGPVLAAADCADELFCVTQVESNGIVECRAENRGNAPMTFTMKIADENHAGNEDHVVTKTVQANSTISVVTFEPRGNGRDGNFCYNYKATIGSRDASHDDDYIYRFPYESGKAYGVLQGYGSRFSHTGKEHYAVDFKMPEGTPVLAARGGIVADYEESNSIGCWDEQEDCAKHANYVVVLHDDGTTGEYYHLQLNGALVERGERVEAGQSIALSGNTGHSTMPHLHFGVYRADRWGRDQSIAVRFISADGIIERPRQGGLYQAISLQHANNKYQQMPTVFQFLDQESTL